jgi:hypothetical protein
MQFERLHFGVKVFDPHADHSIKRRAWHVAGIRLMKVFKGLQHLQTNLALSLIASGQL